MFTIGHSTHSLDDLVGLLRTRNVRVLADVRAHPGSRRAPQFNRATLERGLPGAGIEYLHLPQLGGRRRPRSDSPNGGWRVEAFRGYADHMGGPEFAAGLSRLEDLAERGGTAIMCAEGLWWRCHRRLVADALFVRGWEVLHISPDGATAAHPLTPFAVVEGTRLVYPPAQAPLEQEG